MNKLVIFDCDGVIVSSKNLHFEAFNNALFKISPEYVIDYQHHLSTYDGLSTTKKLQLLTKNKNLEPKYYQQIWEDKQKETFELIKNYDKDEKLINIFKKLKELNFKIGVASNSIRETVKLFLLKLGIMEYVDLYVSNEDVKRPKPFPEMYWKIMSELNCIPKNTIIIEDSHIGRQGALDSGAHLLAVENPEDLTLDKIYDKIKETEGMNKKQYIPWINKNLNVVVAMAGKGSRFSEKGYTFPKPLIDVKGKPMIQVVVENLNMEANFIFLVLKEHVEKYHIDSTLKLLKPDCKIVVVDEVTQGSPCTVLLAKELIDNDNPLFLANCDQFIEWDANNVMYSFQNDMIDGGILVFNDTHPRWSFSKLNENGFVQEVAEKNPISNIAHTGLYYWKKGSDFVKYAEQMISKNIRINGEFYSAPVYNEAILDNKKIKVRYVDKMWGIGIPEDLEYFINNYKGDL